MKNLALAFLATFLTLCLTAPADACHGGLFGRSGGCGGGGGLFGWRNKRQQQHQQTTVIQVHVAPAWTAPPPGMPPKDGEPQPVPATPPPAPPQATPPVQYRSHVQYTVPAVRVQVIYGGPAGAYGSRCGAGGCR